MKKKECKSLALFSNVIDALNDVPDETDYFQITQM